MSGITKFGPQHFSVGTTFRLKPDSRFLQQPEDPEVWTCVSVTCNGPDSWVVKTGVFKEITSKFTMEPIVTRIETGFNIEHIGEIIKRGNGGVKIDYGYQSVSNWNQRSEQHQQFLKDLVNMSMSRTGTRSSKVETIAINTYVRFYCMLDVPAGLMVDYDLLAGMAFRQTWCKRRGTEYFTYCQVDLKRLRRFVKQNYNRALTPMKALREHEERMLDEIDNHDFEYGRSPPHSNLDEDYEGSSFDEDGRDDIPSPWSLDSADDDFPNQCEVPDQFPG